MPRESLGFLRTGARFVRAAVDMRRNLTSGILKTGCFSSDAAMIEALDREPYSFCDDTLGILPLKTRHELILNLAQGVCLSIRSRLGGNYCSNVS